MASDGWSSNVKISSYKKILFDFLSSFAVLFSKDYENNSKNSLKKLLEKETAKLDEKLNKKFLYEDILTFDEQPSDAIL